MTVVSIIGLIGKIRQRARLMPQGQSFVQFLGRGIHAKLLKTLAGSAEVLVERAHQLIEAFIGPPKIAPEIAEISGYDTQSIIKLLT